MTTQRKPRFFRYSLRTLLLVMTVACLWMGLTVKRARDRKQAVEVIRDQGGFVRYEHETRQFDPPGPESIRQLIGDEYFFTVAHVGFDIPGPTGRPSSVPATR